MGRKTRQNKITSPELIAQINPKNIRLMNDFLEYLRSIGKADSTVKAYTSDLYIFFVWVLQNADNKYFPEISKRDIISYQNWLLRNNENSPARVRRLKSTLSSLSNYIEAILDDELPNFRSIVRKIENPVNEPTREKTVLTDEQADQLLDYLMERGQYEKACCFALARYSGRRKSELTRFKVSYFDDEKSERRARASTEKCLPAMCWQSLSSTTSMRGWRSGQSWVSKVSGCSLTGTILRRRCLSLH